MKLSALTKILSALGFSALIAYCTPKRENAEKIATKANHERFEEKDSRQEADFVVRAVGSNYADIKLARLAMRKSSSPEVQEIAMQLDRDNTKLLHDLIAFANEKGISIPLEESIQSRHQIEALETKDASDFDKKWCSEMMTKYEKTIKMFEDMLDTTEDARLKDWISDTLPNLKNHLEQLVERQESKS